MSKYYAIKNGKVNGIYRDWPTAESQVKGFKGAVYKSFKTEKEALEYMNDTIVKNDINVTKNVNDINKIKNEKYIKPYNIDLLIYTDGSSKNKVGGYGFIAIDLSTDLIIKKGSGLVPGICTNQKAELVAIHQALLYIQDLRFKKIMIRTDSNWSIQCFTSFIYGWLKNGFYTAKKEPVKHKELIMEIFQLLLQKPITFEHIYSHEGEIYNEKVDKLAKLYTM